MAKLYAEITSDKGGRKVGKGGKDRVTVDMHVNNHKHITIHLHSDGNVDIIKGNGEFVTTYSPHYLTS